MKETRVHEPLLSVKDLVTVFQTRDGDIRAVDGVSFDVAPGETLAIVGESGSGKSVTALSILRLLPRSNGKIDRGSVLFQGRDLVKANERDLRQIRGRDIAMVFQDPMAYLNPTLTIGTQVVEAIRAHSNRYSREAARKKAVELLTLVGIPNPERCLSQYPHEYSGGMRQRVMIAMAIANEPKLIIADEPTTALDVTIQAQVIDVLRRIQSETGAALLLITHDLALAREVVENVIVMYAGRIVERAACSTLFASPRHPYASQLVTSLPRLDVVYSRLPTIAGQPSVRIGTVSGCVFEPRCGLGHGRERCQTTTPDLRGAGDPRHLVACHYFDEVEAWHAENLAALEREGAAR
jgi:oligopeptide/dipeptide ABC transporter ATP-binding protein